ncbi:SDR family NAD(P)-dependent oxidoreductase [Nocardioides sp. B-3]|uniref:SDR family NAD(P)-dependent oxidoreductase n=1 Tax=Nocardioides sp. B-3 TaxID=2895565 RepID=UPI002153152B|nr:SDR family oxidoreductase [Nocardioides sp. B-3]UUZ60423.1 SDR family oxidoreductase [Nocardioides sp. B-3]
MDLELSGRRAFVTGASRGIGLAIARGLALEGATVSIFARHPDGLRSAVVELSRDGLTAHPYAGDVTDSAALEEAIARSATEQGGLDVMVANAGGVQGGGLQTSTAADWAYTMGINVVHAATAIRAGLPWLSVSGEGAAPVIGSICGLKPRANSSYSVAKAAEIHLAPSLAVELAKEKVRVNTLSPGAVMFDGGRWAGTRAVDPEAHDRFVADNAPTGRFVRLEEVADAACFPGQPSGFGDQRSARRGRRRPGPADGPPGLSVKDAASAAGSSPILATCS